MAHPITLAKGFSYNMLKAELDLTKDEKEWFSRYLAAYEGDYWQDGKGPILPEISKVGNSSLLTDTFKNRLVTRNILLEMVQRVSSVFLGKGPNWNYVVGGKRINLRILEKQQNEKQKRESAEQNLEASDLLPPKPPEKKAEPPAPDDDAPVKRPKLPQFAQPREEPDPQELELAARVEEADKLLGEYYTREQLAEKFAAAFERRLVSKRGGLRIFIPAKYKKTRNAIEKDPQTGDEKEVQVTEVKFENMDEALKAIKVEFVDPRASRMLDDDGELFSMVMYERRTDWDTKDMTKIIEFSFVDDEGRTFIGRVTENETTDTPGANGAGDKTPGIKKLQTKDPNSISDPMELDGNTTFYEIKGAPYVSESMYKLCQGAILALTCGGFNIVDNGFGEMVTTNVALEEIDVPDPTSETGVMKKAVGIKRGGGVHNNFIGVDTWNPELGTRSYATPGVHFREPTSMQTFQDGYYLYYAAALEEGGQKYALIAGDATVSGESRIQAMADFYLKAKPYKPDVDNMGSWAMTTILRMAAMLCGKEKDFDDVSILFDSRMRIGNLTSDEKAQVVAQQEKGIISLETARVLLDVEDPALEQDLIDKERERDQIMNPERLFEAQMNKAMLEEGGGLPNNPGVGS